MTDEIFHVTTLDDKKAVCLNENRLVSKFLHQMRKITVEVSKKSHMLKYCTIMTSSFLKI